MGLEVREADGQYHKCSKCGKPAIAWFGYHSLACKDCFKKGGVFKITRYGSYNGNPSHEYDGGDSVSVRDVFPLMDQAAAVIAGLTDDCPDLVKQLREKVLILGGEDVESFD